MARSYQTWGYNPGRDITTELSREEEAQARHLADFDTKNHVTANELLAYEIGELSNEEFVQLFQKLVNSGLAWKLQGAYGRTAQALLDNGIIEPAPEEN